ncbi:hypothetical protein [Rhodohalobacter halophilus]|uniref:hypothetical protein n=1 Tax=Rhodohalobacter halophilus TaxID=1812810 RepID=UPI00083F81BF|nr:hypothetical protein [Rhodohalobacter halophilus]
MNKIEFYKTANIFVNTGIVALHRYINRFQSENDKFSEITNELLSDKLVVENESLLELLEEVYYYMGKEVYDTPTKEQKRKSDKYFFIKEPFDFDTFPKMTSFGLAGFITKAPFGPAPTPRIKPRKFKDIYEEDPDFAMNIASVFRKNDMTLKYFEITEDKVIPNEKQKKGDSNIYLNEPYTKVPRLDFDEKYFEDGENICPITNESFAKLESSKGTFAFKANVTNFNSFFGTDDNNKISFKAKYLSLFSPALAMYSYYNGYDSFTASFFDSSTLTNINSLYDNEFFYIKDEMENMKPPFHRNIKFQNFKFAEKDGEEGEIDSGIGANSPSVITFLLIYTFYKKKFQTEIDSQEIEAEIDPFEGSPFEKIPISLITFKADKFGRNTMRPNFYEEYNNLKFIVRLLHKMESNKDKRIAVKTFWQGLRIKIPKYTSKKGFSKSKEYAEGQIRQSVISKILKGKSVLSDFEKLFSKCYLILTSGKQCGYRRYDLLTEFLKIYEPAINFGGMNMDKSLQQKAINFGVMIGQAILRYDNPKNDTEKKSNAKNGRKYLISLHKARTIDQFREAIIRIQNRFTLSVPKEIIESMNEQNFKGIKQYAQISALNQLNSALSNN